MTQKNAQKQVMVERSPKLGGSRTIRNRFENRPFSAEQVRKIMLACDNLRDSTILHLGFNTGMRVSEIVSFIPDNIDWQQGMIKIWDEKKDTYRWIMPPLESLNKLKQYINENKIGGKSVFDISKKTVERIIQRWCNEALGFRKSWHSVRHTYITLSSEKQQNIAIVISNTGDAPATILKHYTKLSPDYMRKSIEEKTIVN